MIGKLKAKMGEKVLEKNTYTDDSEEGDRPVAERKGEIFNSGDEAGEGLHRGEYSTFRWSQTTLLWGALE